MKIKLHTKPVTPEDRLDVKKLLSRMDSKRISFHLHRDGVQTVNLAPALQS